MAPLLLKTLIVTQVREVKSKKFLLSSESPPKIDYQGNSAKTITKVTAFFLPTAGTFYKYRDGAAPFN